MKKISILFIIWLLNILSSCMVKQYDNNNNQTTSNPVLTDVVLPKTCIDGEEPIITAISTNSWYINTNIKIEWCNFSGFEWDKNIWIENEQGIKWILYAQDWSNSKLINITIKSPICQNDISYSGLECEYMLELIPWNYKIFTMPWWKMSNKIDFRIIDSNIKNNLSYKDIIDFLDTNITEIIKSYSIIKPTNWQWFVDWFWFTSVNHVYIDYEDGHYLYRALLECNKENNILSCNPIGIFEKQKNWWRVIQWLDSQKDNDIIYKWSKNY